MSTTENRPASAATDVGEFITDLDGGMFDRLLSIALSETAAAVVDHEKAGEVVVKFKMAKIAGTSQVRIGHSLKFIKPTSMGKSIEETDSATVLHVGEFGALSLAQPSLLEKRQNDLSL
jgi:hypothetical protein